MLHTDFPHNYEVVVNPELPGTGKWSIPEFYVPQDFRPKPNTGHLILRLKIDDKWRIWHMDAADDSEVWTTPDPDRILVRGMEGMVLVSVGDIQNAAKINGYDLAITPARGHDLLLVSNYFSVLALGATGICWKTPRIFLDDMTIEGIEGDRVICSGRSLSDIEKNIRVVLDIFTGKVLESDESRQGEQSSRNILSWLKQKLGKG